jgi:hypothetical protein
VAEKAEKGLMSEHGMRYRKEGGQAIVAIQRNTNLENRTPGYLSEI